jgi:hypothetical protein
MFTRLLVGQGHRVSSKLLSAVGRTSSQQIRKRYRNRLQLHRGLNIRIRTTHSMLYYQTGYKERLRGDDPRSRELKADRDSPASATIGPSSPKAQARRHPFSCRSQLYAERYHNGSTIDSQGTAIRILKDMDAVYGDRPDGMLNIRVTILSNAEPYPDFSTSRYRLDGTCISLVLRSDATPGPREPAADLGCPLYAGGPRCVPALAGQEKPHRNFLHRHCAIDRMSCRLRSSIRFVHSFLV